MVVNIQPVQTKVEIDLIRHLFREYQTFLDVDLCFQGFEKELAGLPGKYSPPDGELLLGLIDEQAVGCVALRKLEDGICEMKRLYVQPNARGTGLGKKLVVEIISCARQRGYALMRLDTLDTLTEAMSLYRSFGFRQVEPYYDNPLPGAVYWELELSES